MVHKTFGPMLYLPETDNLPEFPSPESLKRKILISTKPPEEYLETQDVKAKGNLRKMRTWSKKSETSQSDADSYNKVT